MKRKLVSIKVMIALVVLFCVILNILIWAKAFQQIAVDRQTTIERAVQRNSNLVLAFENYTSRTIKNADMLLQLVRSDFEKNKKSANYKSLFESPSVENKLLDGTGILDNKGDLISSNIDYQSDTTLNFHDREYFQYHHNHSNDTLFISKPVTSRTLGKAVIVFSRRIYNDDSTFGGVVALQIVPSTFTLFYNGAALNKEDVLSLISPDGITYARRTGSTEGYGEDISKGNLFKYGITKAVGSYLAAGAIQKVPKYFSYRKLDRYPLIAIVGTPQQDVLAQYYVRKRREIIVSIVMSSLIVLFGVFVITGILYRRKSHRLLKTNEEKYRLIFENSKDAIVLFKPGGEVVAMNPAAYDIFRVKANDAKGLNFEKLLYPESLTDAGIKNISLTTEFFNGELEFYRQDGTSFYAEAVSSTYVFAKDSRLTVAVIRDTTERRELQRKIINEKKSRQRIITRQVIQAQERERESIGRELHDNVNQILATAKLLLGMAGKEIKLKEDELLSNSIDLIDNAIDEIRNLSHKLSAPTLGNRSLVDSINNLTKNLNAAGKFRVAFFYDGFIDQIEMDQKLAIYRIVQEQLNNTLKHSDATDIIITITHEDLSTKLVIKDNGVGFDVRLKGKGIGLNNIEARVKAFSGHVSIISAPGKGCILEASFPDNKIKSKAI